jgi:hypothetical protein
MNSQFRECEAHSGLWRACDWTDMMDKSPQDGAVAAFRNASEFLAYVRAELAHSDATRAIELMRELSVPWPTSPAYLYAALQAATHFSGFLLVVDENLDVRSNTYERQLRVVLAAIINPNDDKAWSRIDKYVLALVSLRDGGVPDDNIALELFLRGGIDRVCR